MTEIPVDWFDAPDDLADDITNNDLEPTEQGWDDYSAFWDTAREWIYPHPLMEGYTCSRGVRHVERQKPWADPVGMTLLPVRRAQDLATYPREETPRDYRS